MQQAYCLCRECVFWDRKGKREGLCRRHAPAAGRRPDEAAHWPETYAEHGCAEGFAAPAPGLVACTDCGYWDRPDEGLIPQRRHGETVGWWAGAGHCFRYAPHPSPEPGARAYRPATSADDACGDGKARGKPSAS